MKSKLEFARNVVSSVLGVVFVVFLAIAFASGCSPQTVQTIESDLHVASLDVGTALADAKANKATITAVLTKIASKSPAAQKVLAPVVTALNNGDLDAAIAANSEISSVSAPLPTSASQ